MPDLGTEIDALAESGVFSGVVRVEIGGAVVLDAAYGQADRRFAIAMTTSTRIAAASGAKGFTALTVMSLVESGALRLDTTARELLGGDLPLIDDAVTVEQLLAHRSGIGDYLDEDLLGEITDYPMTEPLHSLATTAGYLPALSRLSMRDPPGTVFRYNNAGYVVLALIAERASGVAFHDLVEQRVCDPAGMTRTAFLRSDELPPDAAVGYLFADGLRTNVLHLPVRGSGDGGIYTTAGDMAAFWHALFGGAIVGLPFLAAMVRPHSVTGSGKRYGLGFWLHRTTTR